MAQEYGKVDICMCADRKFRALSAPPPNAQTLWTYPLAPRERTLIPGDIPVGVGSIAESLRWPYEAAAACFGELMVQGMAELDPSGPLIWLPNAIKRNLPSNPNQVTGWGEDWATTPECPLKHKAWLALRAAIRAKGEGFARAFRASFPEPGTEPLPITVPLNGSAKGSRKGSRNGRGNGGGNQKQEQKQEQKTAGLQERNASDESPGPEGDTGPAKSAAAGANAASGEGAASQRQDGGDAAAGGIPAEPRGAAGPAPSAATDPEPGQGASPMCPVTPASSRGVRSVAVDEERPPPRRLAVVNLVDRPLVAEFRERLQRHLGHGIVVAKAGEEPAVAGELEEILAVQAVEQALRFVVTTARRRGETPGSLTWCLAVLRDMPAPED